jgi:hypothetical protein
MTETEQPLPEYEPPQVVSYTQEEILEQLGPAQTLYGGSANIPGSW